MDSAAVEILLVEDNPMDVELTLHALRQENLGNSIFVARDGEEALQFLSHCKSELMAGIGLPKLILLDLKLPKVDGLEVLRQIKSDPVTKLIPVVILTSSKQDEDLVASYSLGVNSYLQKPVDFVQFRNLVKELGMYWLVVNTLPTNFAIRERVPIESHSQ